MHWRLSPHSRTLFCTLFFHKKLHRKKCSRCSWTLHTHSTDLLCLQLSLQWRLEKNICFSVTRFRCFYMRLSHVGWSPQTIYACRTSCLVNKGLIIRMYRSTHQNIASFLLELGGTHICIANSKTGTLHKPFIRPCNTTHTCMIMISSPLPPFTKGNQL